ncbi:MAG: Trk system potassium transporter TrkA [Thermoplasmata archaeon]|nr:MAG: Trk system potassium transporter TrkA [Thermoplasmata archaeon]
MYAVIGGAGEMGYQVARILLREGFDLAIIERKGERIDEISNLDALIVRGNAASPRVLKNAGVDRANIYLGLTGSDEANIVSCAIAKAKGCRTIGRIESGDYLVEPVSGSLSRFGVDTAVCPDLVASRKIARMITTSYLVDMEIFAGGKLQVFELPIRDFESFAGAKVGDIPMPPGSRIIAYVRGREIFIARPQDQLRGDERLIIVCTDMRTIGAIGEVTGDKNLQTRVSKIMIYGATRVGIDLAKSMERRCEVILMDDNEESCRKAAESVKDALVINGSATDENVLEEEGISDVDAFIAVTKYEETNMLASLLAKQYGAKRTVALINKGAHKSMFERVGIDVAISPRLATVGVILQNIYAGTAIAMSVMHNAELKIAEMYVDASSKIANRILRKVKLPEGATIVGILRGDALLEIDDSTHILPGDRVVIATLADVSTKITNIFERRKIL